MEEKGYIHLLRPLVSPGIIFLVVYPLAGVLLYLLLKFPPLEVKTLAILYGIAALGIVFLWVLAKSKRVYILEDKIIFQSFLGEKTVLPSDIRRIVFSWNTKGQEVATIRTHHETFYLSEFYFPFPELMADLEDFIRFNDIRSNIVDGEEE